MWPTDKGGNEMSGDNTHDIVSGRLGAQTGRWRWFSIGISVLVLMLTSCDESASSVGEEDVGGMLIDSRIVDDQFTLDEAAAVLDMDVNQRDDGVSDVGPEMDGPNAQEDVGEPSTSVYLPDNGPSHLGLSVVSVDNEGAVLTAIEQAVAGQAITLEPGHYAFEQLIVVRADGRADAPIFFRAERLGDVVITLTHIENFKIYGKHWVFENIRFVGGCMDGSGCEHAFHLVGDADDIFIRNNEVLNFASHVKLNGEVIDNGPARAFPDRANFIKNVWRNDRYISNAAPHNILNLDGGRNHVVRGNVFADFAAAQGSRRSASAIYPKASARGFLIEQNLVVCEQQRDSGETARGIQLGDGAGASICDGDTDGDGLGDCEVNGQSQEGLVRNNIIINCNNGGSSAGIMVSDDRDSFIAHNTVLLSAPRAGAFFVGNPNFETRWQSNLIEGGFDTNFARGQLIESDNLSLEAGDVSDIFVAVDAGDLTLRNGSTAVDLGPRLLEVQYDFCGNPRVQMTSRGAIDYATTQTDSPCYEYIQMLFQRIL